MCPLQVFLPGYPYAITGPSTFVEPEWCFSTLLGVPIADEQSIRVRVMIAEALYK